MNKTHLPTKTSFQLIAICAAVAVSIVAYLYFLNMSVVHVVMRKEATQESAQLRAEIAMLETEFIEAKHTIATRVSQLDGFDTEVEKIFVARSDRDTLARNN
jgi:hypothetical protein